MENPSPSDWILFVVNSPPEVASSSSGRGNKGHKGRSSDSRSRGIFGGNRDQQKANDNASASAGSSGSSDVGGGASNDDSGAPRNGGGGGASAPVTVGLTMGASASGSPPKFIEATFAPKHGGEAVQNFVLDANVHHPTMTNFERYLDAASHDYAVQIYHFDDADPAWRPHLISSLSHAPFDGQSGAAAHLVRPLTPSVASAATASSAETLSTQASSSATSTTTGDEAAASQHQLLSTVHEDALARSPSEPSHVPPPPDASRQDSVPSDTQHSHTAPPAATDAHSDANSHNLPHPHPHPSSSPLLSPAVPADGGGTGGSISRVSSAQYLHVGVAQQHEGGGGHDGHRSATPSVAWSVASLPDQERRRSVTEENGDAGVPTTPEDANAEGADAEDTDTDTPSGSGGGPVLSPQALKSLPGEGAASPSPSITNSPQPMPMRAQSPTPSATAAGAFTPIPRPTSPPAHNRANSSHSIEQDASSGVGVGASKAAAARGGRETPTPEWSVDEDTRTQVPLDMLEELTELGELQDASSQMRHYVIENYFESSNRIRAFQKIRLENLEKLRIEKFVKRLREEERARRRDMRAKLKTKIKLDPLIKNQAGKSQCDIQDWRCWRCHWHRKLVVRGGQARYCEYTGKMFCQKCHFGESVELPSRLVNDLDTAKFSVCHVAKNELTRVFEMPVIPRCRIRSTLYFDSRVLQRLSLIQQRFFAMRPIIRLCPQKKELRNMLGSRYYLLHEEDLISMRDLISVLSSDLVDRLEAVVHRFERHIVRECTPCCSRGSICGYCMDPQPIFLFQLPFVLECAACGVLYHTRCLDPARKDCYRCQQPVDGSAPVPAVAAPAAAAAPTASAASKSNGKATSEVDDSRRKTFRLDQEEDAGGEPVTARSA